MPMGTPMRGVRVGARAIAVAHTVGVRVPIEVRAAAMVGVAS